MLPGEAQGGESELVPRVGAYVTTLEKSALALRDEVEAKVAQGFIDFARVKGWGWFRSWVTFQLYDPIVVSGHSIRLDKEVITADGRAAWRNHLVDSRNKLPCWSNLLNVRLSQRRAQT